MTRAAAVVLVVALALSACSGDDDDSAPATKTSIDRAGSTRVEGASSVDIGTPLDGYAVTYRVERVRKGTVAESMATLTVERPFTSRLETSAGALTVADFAYLGTQPASGDPTVVTAAPAAAPSDVRADLVAGDGTGEVREVLDRRCEIHRVGAPVLGGNGELVAGDDVDLCIDADGVLLEQVARKGSTITERWVATKVDTDATLATDAVRLKGIEATPAAEGGGSVQEIDPATAPPGTFWQLDTPPEGFIRKGRYAVVPPQAASTDDTNTRSQVVAGVSDVFVRGRDVLIIDQGGTLGGVPPFGVHPGATSVDLGEVAKVAEVFATPTGFEARALLPPGHYVKVIGTLPVEELIAIARQLHPIDGQGITYR